jgi:hypothetical protein
LFSDAACDCIRSFLSYWEHVLNSLSLQELATENRLLRTLQKRQALALSRYEGTKAVLPQLIRSHNEEVRVLTVNIKHVSIVD